MSNNTTRAGLWLAAAAIAVAVALPSAPAIAQAPESPPAPAFDWSQFKNGQTLRLTVLGAAGNDGPARVEGRFVGRVDRDVLLETDGRQTLVPSGRVTAVERRRSRGRAAGTGALWGGLIGAGLGAWAGSNDEDEGDMFEITAGSGALLVGVFGVSAGALLGVLSGGGWQQIEPEVEHLTAALLRGPRFEVGGIGVPRGGGIGLCITF